MASVKVLNVALHGEPVGVITHIPPDRNQFVFGEEYIANSERSVLSLSFKDVHGGLFTESKASRVRVPPFFSNLLPEGHLREYLAKRAHLNPAREFFLLWALGGDLPGAVRVEADDDQQWSSGAPTADDNAGARADGPLRFSLAGVQLKFSAVRSADGGLTIPVDGAGGAWIAKLPSPRYESLPENEYSMMELARRVGVHVPETQLLRTEAVSGLPRGVESVGEYIFAIKRFDRSELDGRIHIEDFAQVFAEFPDDKYGKASYQNIATVIAAEMPDDDAVEFIRRLVVSVLIGNADMHLKNWSVIYRDRINPALAPAYDFVSTIAYISDDSLGLSLAGTKKFTEVDSARIEKLASKSRLPKSLAAGALEETVREFKKVWNSSDDLPIPPKVRAAIDAHLGDLPIWRI